MRHPSSTLACWCPPPVRRQDPSLVVRARLTAQRLVGACSGRAGQGPDDKGPGPSLLRLRPDAVAPTDGAREVSASRWGGTSPRSEAPHRRARGRRGPAFFQPWLMLLCCLSLLLLAVAGTPAGAVEPDEMLQDPALEARARALSQELRCLVCQNQSIDDSNAALARDLRLLVRERLTAGDGDAAVLAFVEARYGEFVLLRPKLNAHTVLLWLAPLLLLAGTAVALIRRTRVGAAADRAAVPLTGAEQRRLQELLQRDPLLPATKQQKRNRPPL
jgi:cytochrome c-type biogenesis protein CcmH